MKKNILSLGLILFLVSLDLFSKYIFYDQGFLSNLMFFQPSCNYGISFSINIPQIIVIFTAILATGLFIYFYHKKTISIAVFVLLIAGTLGNLFDRIFFGCVRDFIVFGNWFIFNIADLFINIGVVLIFLKEIFSNKKN